MNLFTKDEIENLVSNTLFFGGGRLLLLFLARLVFGGKPDQACLLTTCYLLKKEDISDEWVKE